MNLQGKLFMLNAVPLLIFVIISLILGITQFRNTMYEEKEGHLRSVALAALTLYSNQGYGDYRREADGSIWRGMNTNISEKTDIVDALKQQTDVDITLFFQDEAVMTSSMNKNGRRNLGMIADAAINTHILEGGKQLWFKEIKVNGENCYAYVIPIRQESDGSVIGALMASQSILKFNTTVERYVLTTLFVMLMVLMAVFGFTYWHVEWFAHKFTEVRDKSRQDLLTGLCNKLTFENDAGLALAQRQPDEVVVLMILDFDNFKNVNDKYGHQMGDAVLKAFADIMIRTFRSGDILGRVGGDEFMALMPRMTQESVGRADEIAQEILAKLRALKIDDAGPFSCSIGIGTSGTGCLFQKLYQLADLALYEAKARGKACYVRYSFEKAPKE